MNSKNFKLLYIPRYSNGRRPRFDRGCVCSNQARGATLTNICLLTLKQFIFLRRILICQFQCMIY